MIIKVILDLGQFVYTFEKNGIQMTIKGNNITNKRKHVLMDSHTSGLSGQIP